MPAVLGCVLEKITNKIPRVHSVSREVERGSEQKIERYNAGSRAAVDRPPQIRQTSFSKEADRSG